MLLLAACEEHLAGSVAVSGASAPGTATRASSAAQALKPPDPEAPTYVPIVVNQTPATAQRHMIAAPHPLAAEAGREMLKAGGSAVDAAIAAQMVLTLVEPQSSGIGGGGFIMHYAAKSGNITAYDGRETAPASAHPYMFLDGTGKEKAFDDAMIGGLSVGVPGLLRMLEMAHKEHGRLPWKTLFQAAIKHAEKGFPISRRLHESIAGAVKHLGLFPDTAKYFLDADGKAKPAGAILVNKPLAATLQLIAERGPDAFYSGPIADDLVKTVQQAPRNPAGMKKSDLAGYKAKKRDPQCMPYHEHLLCGMGPPSSGGLTVLQILGILQKFNVAQMKPGSVESVHVIAEASRLAFADRNAFIGDPDFVSVPTAGMLAPDYLEKRAGEISLSRAASGKVAPGALSAKHTRLSLPDAVAEGDSTDHVSVIDADGNAVAMTTSIEHQFGSRLMVRGFLLNNQLTDFNFTPNDGNVPVPNRVAPGKRPRSSMAPTLVFDGQGRVVMAVGSPGGSRIIGYVLNSIIAALDWKLNIQEALELPHFVNRNGKTELEAGTPLEKLRPALEKLGHEVDVVRMQSGLHGLMAVDGRLTGGADPRGVGLAVGD
ncbi:MAG: gamma-glutamyltransferase [Rhodospirillales bacterium]|nr:gamma-glutamyltransferase [Rhodospirillales bacterium]